MFRSKINYKILSQDKCLKTKHILSPFENYSKYFPDSIVQDKAIKTGTVG
jgi:hypothetical protein